MAAICIEIEEEERELKGDLGSEAQNRLKRRREKSFIYIACSARKRANEGSLRLAEDIPVLFCGFCIHSCAFGGPGEPSR